MITTDTQGLTAGEVKIPTKDGEMPAYRDDTGKTGLPTVLVVQEVFGVHEHIKDVARRLAKQGYLAVAPELYARQGDPTKYTDTGALMKEVVSKVSDAQVMADLDAAAAGSRKRRRRQAGHHRILLGRTHRSYVCRTIRTWRQQGGTAQDRARITRATKPRSMSRPDQGAGAWTVRRR